MNRAVELWVGVAEARVPSEVWHIAREVEAEGWDGLLLTEGDDPGGDPFVAASLGALSTSALRFETEVTDLAGRSARQAAISAASVASVAVNRFGLGVHVGGVSAACAGRYLSDVRSRVAGRGVAIHARASTTELLAVAARHADGVIVDTGTDLGAVAVAVEHIRGVDDGNVQPPPLLIAVEPVADWVGRDDERGIARLERLAALGFGRIVLTIERVGRDRADAMRQRLAAEVISALR